MADAAPAPRLDRQASTARRNVRTMSLGRWGGGGGGGGNGDLPFQQRGPATATTARRPTGEDAAAGAAHRPPPALNAYAAAHAATIGKGDVSVVE
jgi:hypothetical protein